MSNINISEFIKEHGITRVLYGPNKGKLNVANVGNVSRETFAALRPAIVAEFDRIDAEFTANLPESKLAGYRELREEMANVASSRKSFAATAESGNSIFSAACTSEKVEELAKRYPAAAAYYEAEKYMQASHFAKSAAGKKACEKILYGENPEIALTEMKSEWNAYISEGR